MRKPRYSLFMLLCLGVFLSVALLAVGGLVVHADVVNPPPVHPPPPPGTTVGPMPTRPTPCEQGPGPHGECKNPATVGPQPCEERDCMGERPTPQSKGQGKRGKRRTPGSSVTSVPTQVATLPPEQTVQVEPTSTICSSDTWIVAYNPTASITTEPKYPVVIRQDSENRGVDIVLSAHSYPVLKQGWRYDREADTCVVVTLVRYDDPIEVFEADYALDGGSMDWINHVLAKQYPGATVLGGPYPKFLPWTEKYGEGTSSAQGRVERLGLIDPGKYWVALYVRTRGTPLTKPIARKFLFSFLVHLRNEALQ